MGAGLWEEWERVVVAWWEECCGCCRAGGRFRCGLEGGRKTLPKVLTLLLCIVRLLSYPSG